MSECMLNFENNAIFKWNYTLTLFIALTIAIFCCSSLGGNLDFPDFPPRQKSFITSTTGWNEMGKTLPFSFLLSTRIRYLRVSGVLDGASRPPGASGGAMVLKDTQHNVRH